MKDELKAAVINARVATAMIRAMGMQAENQHRMNCGSSIAYGEEAFVAVVEEEGIHQNAIGACKMADLTCDCSPDSNPQVREADKLPPGRFGARLYVRCLDCRRIGGLGDTERDAIWAWEHGERTVEE